MLEKKVPSLIEFLVGIELNPILTEVLLFRTPPV